MADYVGKYYPLPMRDNNDAQLFLKIESVRDAGDRKRMHVTHDSEGHALEMRLMQAPSIAVCGTLCFDDSTPYYVSGGQDLIDLLRGIGLILHKDQKVGMTLIPYDWMLIQGTLVDTTPRWAPARVGSVLLYRGKHWRVESVIDYFDDGVTRMILSSSTEDGAVRRWRGCKFTHYALSVNDDVCKEAPDVLFKITGYAPVLSYHDEPEPYNELEFRGV